MRKIYSLLLLAAFLLAGGMMPAMAQTYTVVKTITINHEEIEKTTLSATWEAVDIDAVCEALGISSISEAAYKCAISDGNGGYTYEDVTEDGWRNPSTGAQLKWGNAGIICTKVWAYNGHDLGNITYIGCYDATHLAGESYSFPWAFVANDKAVILDVVITFVKAPTFKPTVLQTITIDYEATEKTAGTFTDNLAISEADLTAIKSALGVSDFSACSTWIVNCTDGNFVGNSTDGWRDGNGDAAQWGTDATGICVKLDLPEGKYNYIGAFNDSHVAGTQYHAKWGVTNSSNQAVVLDLVISFVAPASVELDISDLSIVTSVNYLTTDASYSSKTISLTDEQVASICAELGVSSLSEATVLAYNPSTGKLLKEYASFDGWRDANGDFHKWAGNATVPVCVKYSNGKDYECFNISGCNAQTIKCYWALANDTKAVLVEIDFIYVSAALYTNAQTDLPQALGNNATVTLQDRTFVAGWNTLVLPFDITVDQLKSATGATDVELATFTSAETDGTTTTVKFAAVDAVPANTPCLVYFGQAVNGPVAFSGINVNEVVPAPTTAGTALDFVGTYVATTVGAGNYVLTTGNAFKKAAGGNALKACRAYLRAKSTGGVKAALIAFDIDGITTAINAIDGVSTDSQWYTIGGQRVAQPMHRGIYVHGGKKVIVK